MHLAQFQELGFEFEISMHKVIANEEAEAFVGAFLIDVVHVRNLAFGGGINGGYIVVNGKGSATDDDREAIKSWMSARSEVAAVRVGPLADAWYPPDF